MSQCIDLGIVLQINPKKSQLFFLFDTPVSFQNIGLLSKAFAQNDGIALWFKVGEHWFFCIIAYFSIMIKGHFL